MDRPRQYRRFRTLLIANRGEIAVRVIRTARAMGLRTVAVYSEADRGAMHVAIADEAVSARTGTGARQLSQHRAGDRGGAQDRRRSRASRLRLPFGERGVRRRPASRRAWCSSVRPPRMMRTMGSKSGSKLLMEQAGVPLVPGYHGEAQDEATLSKAAGKIGFPVLVKASAGGGGRGMRIVRGGQRACRRRRQRQARGQGGLRRRPHIDRKIRRKPAAHRGAGDRRQSRQSAVAVRARMHACSAGIRR